MTPFISSPSRKLTSPYSSLNLNRPWFFLPQTNCASKTPTSTIEYWWIHLLSDLKMMEPNHDFLSPTCNRWLLMAWSTLLGFNFWWSCRIVTSPIARLHCYLLLITILEFLILDLTVHKIWWDIVLIHVGFA